MSGGGVDGPIVLGGGVAGAAVATLLARAGVRVMLIEQHREPRHKVCGEFLSAEACETLRELGLDLQTLGAVAVRQVRFAGAGGCVGHRLPFEACSLTRRALDEAMLRMAEASGVHVLRGERVEALEATASGADARWRVRTSSGMEMQANDIFVASGKHDLRGHPRPEGRQGSLIAFKQYFRLASEQRAELHDAIELIVFRGGYAGLQMVEGECANLCLLVDRRRFSELGGSWPALLDQMQVESRHLRARLRGAEAVLDRPLSLSRIPYGYLRRDVTARGLWYLGDQAAVIPSFSGDGMSIALHTARVAAEVFLGGGEASLDGGAMLSRRLHAELGRLMMRATILSRLMVARGGQIAIAGLVRAAPSMLSGAASLTRIPGTARARLAGL